MSDYKDTNINNPGTATQYGADDNEKIARLLNGQTSGVGGPKIKTQDKFGFWDGILYVRNQSDTWNVNIRGPTNNPGSNLDLTLPPIIANDILAAIGLAQTWTAKQRYNLGIVFPEQSTPGLPGASLHNVFVSASGHLQKIDNNGTVKDYDISAATVPVDIIDGTLASRMARTVITRSGSTYYAIRGDGTIVSSGANPNTVIAAALALNGTVWIGAEGEGNDLNFDIQAGFTGFDVDSFTYVFISKDVNINLPNGYTGHCFNIIGHECGIVSFGGYINEQGTVSRNWTAVRVGTGTSADDIYHVIVKGIYGYQAGTLLEILQGSTGTIQLVEIDGIEGTDFKKGIVWTTSSSTLIHDVVIKHCKFNASTSVTTDGFKGVAGTRNQFYGNMFKDFTGAMNEMDISANGVDTQIFGGNHTGAVGTYTDAGTDTYISDSIHTEWKLKGTALTPSTITSNQNDYSPTNWNEKKNTLRLASDASRNITGLVPGANPKNRLVHIVNIGSNDIVLTNEDSNSTAANRFALNTNLVLTASQSVLLKYDSISSRWRPVGPSGYALLSAQNTFLNTLEVLLDQEGQFWFSRDNNTNGIQWGAQYYAKDSANNWEQYGELKHEIVTNTNGSEVSRFQIGQYTGGAKKYIYTPQITADDKFAVLDFPQTITNKTLDAINNLFKNIYQMPIKGRWGAYMASGSDSEEGVMQGTTTSGTSGTSVDANGPIRTYQTAATTGSIAGKRKNNLYFRRDLNPVLQFIFKCEQITVARFYCGIFDFTTALGNNDTPLNNQSGICVGFRSTDTNWQIIRNDGDASQDVVDTGVAKDTGLHWFEIVASKSGNSFTVRFGNYASGAYATQFTPAAYTTEIPGATTDLTHNISLITNENVAKTLDIYAMAIHID